MKDSETVSLFIDTATKSLALGLIYGQVKDTSDLGNPKLALENTNLGIETLLAKHGLKLRDVDAFYCLLGPGSNTGIRLGLTIPRTIYAFNPSIRIYGIKTMDLLTLKADHAALSDRNGNLFLAERKGAEVSYQRVDKKDIPSLEKFDALVIENSDTMAKEELPNQNLLLADVVSLMMEEKENFVDYSKKEEEFLPEYTQVL